MATGFTPKKLIFGNNNSSQAIKYTNDVGGNGNWGDLSFSPADGQLSGNIVNQTATSCTINVTSNSYSGDSVKNYIGSFSMESDLRPLAVDFEVSVLPISNGFFPTSISAPASGGNYTIYYVANKTISNAQITFNNSNNLLYYNNLIIANNSISFNLSINNNNLPDDINASASIKLFYLDGTNITLGYVISIAGNRIITCNPTSLSFPSSQSQKTVTVSTNITNLSNFTAVADSAATSFVNSIAVSKINNQSANIIIEVNKNSGSTERSGNIIITYDNYSINYPITQAKGNTGRINIQNDFQIINFDVTSGQSSVLLMNIGSTLTASSDSDWLNASYSANIVSYTCSKNFTDTIRTGIITLSGTDFEGNEVSDTLTVQQLAYNIFPIAQDVLVNYASNESFLEYNISVNNNIIYSGKSYKYPDSNNISFYLNKVCYNFLNSNLPDDFPFNGYSTNIFKLNNYATEFDLTTTAGNSLIGSYVFYNSYDYDFSDLNSKINMYNNIVISHPVKYEIDRRQYFLYTLFQQYDLDTPVTLSYKLKNSKNGNEQILLSTPISDLGAYLLIDNTLFQYPDFDTIEINGDTYKIVDSCAEYCLYYLNASGGWDSLLITGNNIKTDDISQNFYNKSFNNTTIEFEKKNYLNIITSSYKFYTSYLTDEQASRMYNLIESNEVYLHNLSTNVIKPVNITDTSFEYKTFTNQQRKKFYYEINVEESQGKIRR